MCKGHYWHMIEDSFTLCGSAWYETGDTTKNYARKILLAGASGGAVFLLHSSANQRLCLIECFGVGVMLGCFRPFKRIQN